MTTDATFRTRSTDARRHVAVGAMALLVAVVVVALLSDVSVASLFVPATEAAVPLPEFGPGVVGPPAIPAPDLPSESLARLEGAMTAVSRELAALADTMVSLATGSR